MQGVAKLRSVAWRRSVVSPPWLFPLKLNRSSSSHYSVVSPWLSVQYSNCRFTLQYTTLQWQHIEVALILNVEGNMECKKISFVTTSSAFFFFPLSYLRFLSHWLTYNRKWDPLRVLRAHLSTIIPSSKICNKKNQIFQQKRGTETMFCLWHSRKAT